MRIKYTLLLLLIPSICYSGMIIQQFSSGGASTLTAALVGDETNGASLPTGSGTVSLTSITYGDNCDSSDASGAFVIDADSDSIQIQTSGNISYSAGRIEMNVTPVGTQANHQYQSLVGDAADYHVFSLSHEANDTIRFRTTNGSIYWTAASTTDVINYGSCNTIVLTWDFAADSATLIINGTSATISSGDMTHAPPSTGTNFMIGSTSSTFSYTGRFDDIKIYSTASGE